MKELFYDVVIVGGGSAGVAAAIAASRMHVKTLLIERDGSFGGEATNSWVSAYCGFYTKGTVPQQVVYGIGDEVLQRLKAYGEDISYTISPSTKNASVRFRPEMIKIVLDDLLQESSVDYRLYTCVIDAETADGEIRSVVMHDDEENVRVYAKVFIDASGNGNLLHMAGLETAWGDEHGEVQQSSLACLIQGTPRKEIPMEVLTSAIQESKNEGDSHLDKEKGLIVKVPADDNGYLTIPSVTIHSLHAQELTTHMMALRKKAYAYASALKKHAEGFSNAYLLATAPRIGIREARRMQGIYSITAQDVFSCKKNRNVIARGGWPVELHRTSGLQYIDVKENDWFDIPMEALMSKDLHNLYAAGRNISCDSVAMASVRVMGTGFATGHAAGVMAACKVLYGDTDINKVQEELRKQNAYI